MQLWQTDSEAEAYQRKNLGMRVPGGWPNHLGIGSCLSHVPRVICNLHGTDMQPPPIDTYEFSEGMNDGVLPNFNHQDVKKAVAKHVNKVSATSMYYRCSAMVKRRQAFSRGGISYA